MKKKRRVLWIVTSIAVACLAAGAFGFLRASSSPFQFLSGSRLVSYKASAPNSHCLNCDDYFQRIFEVDREMSVVRNEMRSELPASQGWVEKSYQDGDFSFHKGDHFIHVMPHGSNPRGTAVLYARDATRFEMWTGYVIYCVPERYRQWQ